MTDGFYFGKGSNVVAKLELEVPVSIREALGEEARRTGTSRSSVVSAALAAYLDISVHSLFQISTSGSLVTGVYSGAISVKALLAHGDFGIGTFENLDGEMVVLDGLAYRVRGTGEVSEADPSATVPFAVVTRFAPTVDAEIKAISTLSELGNCCDSYRSSKNIFYAIRLDGIFTRVQTRAVSPPQAGGGLIAAAKAQHEFSLTDVAAALVGIWSPGFSSAFSIPGYHFHFLTDDRRHGGHLLECSAQSLRLRMEALTDFHLALPETEAFLKADLSKNSADELAYAEAAHSEKNVGQ
jgi:acetolactate decarboxylase